ncbi:MAG: carotenoid oxygenase family protein [Myxococcota bacterium]|nr:carotenoid oxygenase family protein [Myxococcota bacterium]
MSDPFSTNNPYLQGNFAPWLEEEDHPDLPVKGELPETLRGSYYRNGSNPPYAPGANYHWFFGDGMIQAFHFDEGRCSHLNRWVRTERYEAQRKYEAGIFGGIGPEASPDPRAEGHSPNASNTHVLWHAGRLLSLWEAGPPYEVDPITLETRGIHDYGGAFYRERFGGRNPDIMTAHPKIDPDTGEWIGFGYSPLEPWLVYHAVGRDGALTRSFELEAPFPSMMHDFIVSADYAVFPIFPAVFDFGVMADTGLPLSWEPERGTHVGVLPRDGTAEDMVWFDHEACYCFHTVNAHVEGSKLIAELFTTPGAPLYQGPGAQPPRLKRWTLDLEKGGLKQEDLDDAPAEFGVIDPRHAGKAYRHIFTMGSVDYPNMKGQPEGFDSIFHYDLKTGRREAHRLPNGDCAGEPCFVPRSRDAEEGDGHVLSIVYRRDENRSDLIVVDTQDFTGEPAAIVQMPHRIPFGFHGSWRPAGGAGR